MKIPKFDSEIDRLGFEFVTGAIGFIAVIIIIGVIWFIAYMMITRNANLKTLKKKVSGKEADDLQYQEYLDWVNENGYEVKYSKLY